MKLAIAAGNQLIDKPYLWGGGHGQPLTELAAALRLLRLDQLRATRRRRARRLRTRTQPNFETYGQPGAGQWITVYANSAHAFIDVAGIVLDTAWYAPVTPTNPSSGPRWQPASIIARPIRRRSS